MHKKSQLASEVFKYALIGFFSALVFIGGYRMIAVVQEKGCNTELAKFEIDLRGIDKELRYGSRELKTYIVPCAVDKIYFFQLDKPIDAERFNSIPIIKDALKTGSDKNVFLVKKGTVKHSFSAGSLDIASPHYLCFRPTLEKMSFYAEGAGTSVKITIPNNQLLCE